MKRLFPLIAFACAVFLSACSTLPTPGHAYDAKVFAVEPVIVQRGERLYLRYRMSLANHPLRMYVVVKKEEAKAVAYFTAFVSWPEYGALEEIPLAPSQVEAFAKSGQFFWRDPDGAERALKIVREE